MEKAAKRVKISENDEVVNTKPSKASKKTPKKKEQKAGKKRKVDEVDIEDPVSNVRQIVEKKLESSTKAKRQSKSEAKVKSKEIPAESKEETKQESEEVKEEIKVEEEKAPAYKKEEKEEPSQFIIMFQNADGESVGDQMVIDSRTTRRNLVSVLNTLLENEEKLPYALYIGDEKQQAEVTSSILDAVKDLSSSQYGPETVIPIIYKPEAMFRVRPITRASTTLEGHTEAILATNFSPDGKNLATGSGD